MRSADVAKLLGIDASPNVLVPRLRDRAGLAAPIGSGYRHSWSPGDVLAMFIVNELDGPGGGVESKWAEGARKCGEALDNGYTPAYLVARGLAENLVVLESENPDATDEMLAAVLMQAIDAGAAVKVVRLREMVRRLAPWMAELVDA